MNAMCIGMWDKVEGVEEAAAVEDGDVQSACWKRVWMGFAHKACVMHRGFDWDCGSGGKVGVGWGACERVLQFSREAWASFRKPEGM